MGARTIHWETEAANFFLRAPKPQRMLSPFAMRHCMGQMTVFFKEADDPQGRFARNRKGWLDPSILGTSRSISCPPPSQSSCFIVCANLAARLLARAPARRRRWLGAGLVRKGRIFQNSSQGALWIPSGAGRGPWEEFLPMWRAQGDPPLHPPPMAASLQECSSSWFSTRKPDARVLGFAFGHHPADGNFLWLAPALVADV